VILSREKLVLAAAFGTLASAILATGCGGGSVEETHLPSKFEREEAKAQAEAPSGASPLLRAVYRQFPPPKPDPKVKDSAKAIAKGEKACHGKAPVEVTEQFLHQGHLSTEKREEVKKVRQYEEHPSYDFPAGQIAAGVYESAASETTGFAYQGCVYMLARALEKRLESE
jgi:hypothetical protein